VESKNDVVKTTITGISVAPAPAPEAVDPLRLKILTIRVAPASE
jgi:hypothetical protein